MLLLRVVDGGLTRIINLLVPCYDLQKQGQNVATISHDAIYQYVGSNIRQYSEKLTELFGRDAHMMRLITGSIIIGFKSRCDGWTVTNKLARNTLTVVQFVINGSMDQWIIECNWTIGIWSKSLFLFFLLRELSK